MMMEALAKEFMRDSGPIGSTAAFPIIIVPNVNNLFVSQSLHSPLELILPVTTENRAISVEQQQQQQQQISSIKEIRMREKVDMLENQFLNPTKVIDQELKSVSPTQLFNIQENNDSAFLSPEEEPNIQKICESALLHESSKNVTLVSENQPATLLDDIPHKSDSFSDSNEISDLFVPIADQMTRPVESTKLSPKKMECAASNSKKYISSLSHCPEKRNNGSSRPDVSSRPLETDELNNLKDFDENSLGNDENFEESHAIVVHLPEDSFYTTDSLSDSKEDVEVKHKTFPLLFPTDTLDLSLIPVTSMDSLLLGNFTLLPNAQSNIKFQVIEDDGTVKRIRLNPVCHTEEPLTVCALNEQEDSSESSSCPPTPNMVTEIVQTTTEKPFRCELCNATFNRLGNYTRHKKIHMVPSKEDKRFHCDICGKHFIQRCDLTRHRHIHSGTEPHRCSTCGKGYIRHSDLVIHQRFHNKEKPFACSHCTKGFSQRGDLNRHLRSIHLQVKPLTCGHCHKKFAKEATLIRHMQITHRDIIINSLTLAKCATEGITIKQENCLSSQLSNLSSSDFSGLKPS